MSQATHNPMKTKSDGNPYHIRNGEVSVSLYQVDVPHLIASALCYARRTGKRVRIWSNDYRNHREKRYAHLEHVVLPDGRSDSSYIMRCGGLWCDFRQPYEGMKPKGHKAAKAAFDGAGPTFQDIFNGWETQP